MAAIHITTEQELQDLFLELAHATHNMRLAQKYWQEHGGYNAREKRKYWETKLDGILNRIGMAEHQNTRSIKVIKQP